MDKSDITLEPKRIVFVTVGSTSFDSLVRYVDTDEVKQGLSKKGYTHLLIQMGRGSYLPKKSNGEDGSLVVDYFTFSSSIADNLRSASLVISHAVAIEMTVPRNADLGILIIDTKDTGPAVPKHFHTDIYHHTVFQGPKRRVLYELANVKVPSAISSLRSGSTFETLRLGKPLIVVVNEDLMDNHQSELAEELAERKHLFCARPQTLYEVIASMDLESTVPYITGDATPVAKLMNRYLGFQED